MWVGGGFRILCLRLLPRRFGFHEPTVVMFSPAEAVSMQQGIPEVLSLPDATAVSKRRDIVAKASLVQIAICADNHFVYLQGQRPAPTSPWELLYRDSLPVEKPVCRAAAENVAMYLGLLPDGGTFPHSQPGVQADGWSCGLWVLQEQEHQLRQCWRFEPATSKAPIQSILHRLNDFVSRVSPAAKVALAECEKKSSRIVPLTIEEAYQAALLCTKCHITKSGHKGCSQCMGPFFKEAAAARKDIGVGKYLGCVCCYGYPRPAALVLSSVTSD